MKKRLFAILLCLVMIVGLLPAGALAAQGAATAAKFVEVTKLTADKEYVLGAVNSDGTVSAISSITSSRAVTAKKLTVAAGNPASVETDDSDLAWKYASDGSFANGGNYLYPTSGGTVMVYTSARAFTFADGHLSFTSSGGSVYYLTFAADAYGVSTDAAEAATFRLFESTAAPVDPTPTPAITGHSVDVTPATSNPNVNASIEVGETLTIKVTNSSTHSGYDYVASLSGSSGVAEFVGASTVNISAGGTGTFTVKGNKDGLVDINLTNNNTQSERKATIHLTVGKGPAPTPTPTPITGPSVSVTPDATNPPSENATIAVDKTLTIIVTNSSTRSGYDYVASLSGSGVAEFVGASTVNIPAGGTGTFAVKGLKDGTVDINLTNNNTQSERKAVIHLTVGKGGTTPTPTPTPAAGLENGNYIIVVNGNAMTSQAGETYTNSGNYDYAGFAGTPYTEGMAVTADMIWTVTKTSDGYQIMQDGKYLRGVYTATTNPTGCDASLSLSSTADTWTLGSDGKLYSVNAEKYLTYGNEIGRAHV